MASIIKILLLMLLASVKFVVAAVPLLISSPRPWYLDMCILLIGGTIGVFVFTYFGAFISSKLGKHPIFKVKFKSIRKLIKMRDSYGLIGLAFISPVLISIPVGCIFSAAIEHNKKKVILYQTLSVVFWSVVLFSLKGMFHVKY